ncbi:MAG: penicillin-binding protein 1A [Gammaproteobacteria bacterium]
MLRFTFNLILFLLLLGLLTIAVISLYIIPGLPDIETLKDIRMQIPLKVYTQDHALIAEYGEKRRAPVAIDEVPQQLIDAFLAAEDDRFYQHPGVDWQGILRAAINLIKTGKKTQGGSTITMQVARNFFLSRKKSYLRKINEIFLALKIERELNKDEILELYLNKIYLGQRAYGVGAAAHVYYGDEVNDLNLQQIAMIAGLPKAPSTTNPVTNPERAIKRRNYVLGRMLEKGYISKQQFDNAMHAPVTASLHNPDIEIEAPYVAEMVRKQLIEEYGEKVYSNGYKIFTTIHSKNQIAANDALRRALLAYDKRHGYRGPEAHFDLREDADTGSRQQLMETFSVIGGLFPALVTEVNDKSVTANIAETGQIEIDWAGFKWARKYVTENRRGPMPETAADVFQVGDVIRAVQDDEGKWKLTQLPDVEGGLVSMKPENGSTVALTGGFDFQRSKFNRVTQALRQPGSSFKPFIYSAALEAGFTAASLINDAPVVFNDPGIEDIWRPENYNKKTRGPTRLREAITHSLNLVSIRLLHAIGVPFALAHLAKFGFDTRQLPHNLSLALGSGAVSPWQLATSYCVLANGGFRIEPYFIERIESYNGGTVFEASPLVACSDCERPLAGQQRRDETPPRESGEGSDQAEKAQPQETGSPNKPTRHYAERVINPQNIWIMNSLTRNVIQNGTGRKARVLHRRDLSGKTGTTNDQRDAWFAGYNSSIVTVTWVGFDKFNKLLGRGETGARAALPMWIDYMRVALEDITESIIDRPPGLVDVRIDRDTGKPAKADDPNSFFETFRVENAPAHSGEQTERNKTGSNAQIPEQLF